MLRIHADAFVSLMGVLVNKLFNVVPAQAVVARWPGTFKELPPRQKPACFNIGAVMENLTAPQGPGK